jgi:hypothetical protein
MTLITLCEVCSTPKAWNNDEERLLLLTHSVVCRHCKQTNLITKDLKNDVKKKYGMLN